MPLLEGCGREVNGQRGAQKRGDKRTNAVLNAVESVTIVLVSRRIANTIKSDHCDRDEGSEIREPSAGASSYPPIANFRRRRCSRNG